MLIPEKLAVDEAYQGTKQFTGIFREAKSKLAHHSRHTDYRHEFICHALSWSTEADKEARRLLRDRLLGQDTFECWLHLVHPAEYRRLKAFDSFVEIQKLRHAWLDSLIEEFTNDNVQ